MHGDATLHSSTLLRHTRPLTLTTRRAEVEQATCASLTDTVRRQCNQYCPLLIAATHCPTLAYCHSHMQSQYQSQLQPHMQPQPQPPHHSLRQLMTDNGGRDDELS